MHRTPRPCLPSVAGPEDLEIRGVRLTQGRHVKLVDQEVVACYVTYTRGDTGLTEVSLHFERHELVLLLLLKSSGGTTFHVYVLVLICQL